jgi:hypothetical protein
MSEPDPRPRFPKLPRRARYRVWSVRTITALGLITAGLTAALVYGLGKRSIFVETELTLTIIAAALFVFLAASLYHGVRVRRRDIPGEVTGVPIEKALDAPDFVSPVIEGAAEGGLPGIAAAILAVVVAFLALMLLWVLLNLGIVLWVFLLTVVAWVFYLALRQVFAKSRVCRGNVSKSLGYALLYTALYTGWLFAVVWIAHGLFGSRLHAG